MSYLAGISVGVAQLLGEPALAGYPRVVCDGCGMVKEVPCPPPVRFLGRKAGWPKGWKTTFTETHRHDLCPSCKAVDPVRSGGAG